MTAAVMALAGPFAGRANALALHWEMVRTSGYYEALDLPAGSMCDFSLQVVSEGSFQEMFGYDQNGVLREYRLQNWGPWSVTVSANGKALSMPRQSVVSTFTFDANGDLLTYVSVGIDNLFVAPGTGFIEGNIGRFIVVDGQVVWKAGPTPDAAAFCEAIA